MWYTNYTVLYVTYTLDTLKCSEHCTYIWLEREDVGELTQHITLETQPQILLRLERLEQDDVGELTQHITLETRPQILVWLEQDDVGELTQHIRTQPQIRETCYCLWVLNLVKLANCSIFGKNIY